ncbi:HAD-IA family hydrolase [Streptomyces shaanxiensis]|uniref:HAD family hydrolase n=1 Tax=Streptomyces shaanxiensis TaxID=653357 RepID=UPI0031E9A1D8
MPPVQAVLFDFSNTIFQMLDLETWLRRVGAACGRLAVLDEPGAEEAAYRELTAPDAWVPYPDTEPVLRALCERGLRVGIVSDFAWDLRTHLAHHGLDALIDTCVISYEQGHEKPDPQLFLKACADLGADPRATLMVGDNPIRDGGAAACGLRTYILPSEHRTGERGLTDVLRLVA